MTASDVKLGAKPAKVVPPAGDAQALATGAVPIDDHCTGDRWTVKDIDHLAKLIALIAMGQAAHAASIIEEFAPAAPAFTHAALVKEAQIKLTVQEKKQTPRTGYPRWQRDGFIFEAISWVAARQSHGSDTYLKDPHVSSTAQGLDGLMIEVTAGKKDITRVTIFEDKCSDDPCAIFSSKVMPAFLDRHKHARSAELIAAAASLIQLSGMSQKEAIAAAEGVLDLGRRRYRASLAVPDSYDTEAQRQKIFEGYDALKDIDPDQRIGATFVVQGKLREWFDELAKRAIAYLGTL